MILATIMKYMSSKGLSSKKGVLREDNMISGSQTWVLIRITKRAYYKDTVIHLTADLLNQNCLGQGDGA